MNIQRRLRRPTPTGARRSPPASGSPLHVEIPKNTGKSARTPRRRTDGPALHRMTASGDGVRHTAASAAWARSISIAPTGMRVVIISTNTSKRYAESCGPGLASGWYCTLKMGLAV